MLLLLAALAFAQVNGLPSAEHLRWGVKSSDLVRSSGGTIEAVDLGSVESQFRIQGLRYGAKSQLEAFEVSYLFTPISDRLAAVMVRPRDKTRCIDWTTELRAQLGEAQSVQTYAGVTTGQWTDIRSGTSLTFTISEKRKDKWCNLMLRPFGPMPNATQL